MLLDSAIEFLISALFTVLLLGASLHKFSDRLRFQGVLAAYNLIPVQLLGFVALLVPLTEMVLGLAWITGLQSVLVAATTACLLTAYTFAIAINIARGNIDIDCGCGVSSKQDRSFQRLSSGLLMRNFLLIMIALISLIPSNERGLGLLDYSSIALACLGLVFLYAAFNQLLANKQFIDSWRRPLMQQGNDRA